MECTPYVYQVRTDAKSLYIKMPYLGTSLYYVPLQTRRKHVLQILGDVAKTCLEMDDIGLQHTDIKHSNITLSKTGEVYLIDFNICSVKHVNENGIWTENLGTWDYASPEICLLQHPTNTSTVWSLGILLCFLFLEHPLQDHMDDHPTIASSQKKWGKYLNALSMQHPFGLPLSEQLIRSLPLEFRELYHECTYWDPLMRISLPAFYERIRSMRIEKNRDASKKFKYQPRPNVQFPSKKFTMSPKQSVERDQDLDTMYKWCEEMNQMFLLCRSVAIYDRISSSNNPEMDAPACLAISYMIVGNYIHLEDPKIARLAQMYYVSNWEHFLRHIVDVCYLMNWDMYELTADVMLLSHMEGPEELHPMMSTVFQIQKEICNSYTMQSIVSSFCDVQKQTAFKEMVRTE